MRILVAGPSTVTAAQVAAVLDELHAKTPVSHVATGPGTGADANATAWAEANGIGWTAYPETEDGILDIMEAKSGERPQIEGYDWPNLLIMAAQPQLAVIFHGYMHTAWMLAAVKRAGLDHLLVPKGSN